MQQPPEQAFKTGTSTVGICFKNGVVVGADHRATMGHFVANKNVQKLFKMGTTSHSPRQGSSATRNPSPEPHR